MFYGDDINVFQQIAVIIIIVLFDPLVLFPGPLILPGATGLICGFKLGIFPIYSALLGIGIGLIATATNFALRFLAERTVWSPHPTRISPEWALIWIPLITITTSIALTWAVCYAYSRTRRTRTRRRNP